MGRAGDTRALAVTLALLLAALLARAASGFLPAMWAWGINLHRFLHPLAAWLPWLLALLLLLPGIARPAAVRLGRLGDRLAAGRGGTRLLAALGAAALVWALPDRTWLTGDFLLRQGAAEAGAPPSIFVQSLPLEVLLNRWVPGLSGPAATLDPNPASRAIGTLAAAGLALAAIALARAWALSGAAAAVAAGTVCFGGFLTAFTGLGKPAAVMVLLSALALAGATRLAVSGRGGVLLGSAVAAALLTHRSALALLPLWLGVLLLARRRPPGERPARRELLPALGLPLAALLVAGPRIVRILRDYDLPHHLAPPAGTQGAWLAAAFAPLHLLDLANLVVLQAPALPVALALAAVAGTRSRPAGATVTAGLIALAFVPLLLFVHPVQGLFRDLEVFAPAGVALAMLSARLIGAALQAGRLPAWLGPALLASVVVPSLQWLVHFHDPARGLARVRSYALEAPARSGSERARIWDGIAYSAFRLRDWERALEATRESARHAPHPRSLMMFAIARTYTGDHRGAESLYVALAERTPGDPLVWVGLGGAALRVGDSLQATRALRRLETYAGESREARLVRHHLRRFPQVWPTASEKLPGRPSATPP